MASRGRKQKLPPLTKADLARAERETVDERLRTRCATMKPSIDMKPPASMQLKHLASNAKRETVLRAKLESIDHENQRLLRNLMEIYGAEDPLHIRDRPGVTHLGSLNVAARKRELERIATENAHLIKRIVLSSVKGSMDPKIMGLDAHAGHHKPAHAARPKREHSDDHDGAELGGTQASDVGNQAASDAPEHAEAAPAEEGGEHRPDDAAPADHAQAGASAAAPTGGAPSPTPARAPGPGRSPSRHTSSLRVYQSSSMADLAAVYDQYERSLMRMPHPSPALGTGTIALLQDKQYAATGRMSKETAEAASAWPPPDFGKSSRKPLGASASAGALPPRDAHAHASTLHKTATVERARDGVAPTSNGVVERHAASSPYSVSQAATTARSRPQSSFGPDHGGGTKRSPRAPPADGNTASGEAAGATSDASAEPHAVKDTDTAEPNDTTKQPQTAPSTKPAVARRSTARASRASATAASAAQKEDAAAPASKSGTPAAKPGAAASKTGERPRSVDKPASKAAPHSDAKVDEPHDHVAAAESKSAEAVEPELGAAEQPAGQVKTVSSKDIRASADGANDAASTPLSTHTEDVPAAPVSARGDGAEAAPQSARSDSAAAAPASASDKNAAVEPSLAHDESAAPAPVSARSQHASEPASSDAAVTEAVSAPRAEAEAASAPAQSEDAATRPAEDSGAPAQETAAKDDNAVIVADAAPTVERVPSNHDVVDAPQASATEAGGLSGAAASSTDTHATPGHATAVDVASHTEPEPAPADAAVGAVDTTASATPAAPQAANAPPAAPDSGAEDDEYADDTQADVDAAEAT